MSTAQPSNLAQRAQFRALLLSNPNYFGNLENSTLKSTIAIAGDTTYEELGCVGYQSQLDRLEGIITIKQSQGYSGGICTSGSLEYVRFFTSTDNGATWVDQGLASTAVFDLGGVPRDVQYAVSLQIEPIEQYCVLGANLPLVRAILQWNVPPPAGQPDFIPVWGNVVNTQIQIESLKIVVLGDLFAQAQFSKAIQPLVDAIDLKQTVVATAKPLSAAALQSLYQSAVPPQRFALADLQALSTQPGVLASSTVVAQLGITIAPTAIAAALAPASGDTAYEQLNCVGFNASASLLEAVLHIKQKSGYSGGLCTAGSREYVAFWADTAGTGTFTTYLGTASVDVYDISTLPTSGLDYAVFLAVDLSPYQKPCSTGPVLLPIRATLSWQVPPTPTNPGFVPTWGNTVQAVIQVPPGEVVGTTITPVITAVGDTAVSNIDSNSSDANLGHATGTTIITGLTLTNSPFGGRIDISGKILNGTAATKYRLMGRPHGSSAFAPITAEPGGLQLWVLNLATLTEDSITIHADADGYYTYQDYDNTVLDSVLMSWQSTSVSDGLYDLYIDVQATPTDLSSSSVTVMVDNTPPAVTLTVNTPVGMQCPDVLPGGTVTGTFSATDAYFQSISWEFLPPLAPTATPPGGFALTVTATLTPDGYPSGTYSVATNAMPPCGYTLTLVATDWCNVNSGESYLSSPASIGFCVMPAGTLPQP